MKETKNLVNKIKSPKKTKLNQNIISARKTPARFCLLCNFNYKKSRKVTKTKQKKRQKSSRKTEHFSLKADTWPEQKNPKLLTRNSHILFI